MKAPIEVAHELAPLNPSRRRALKMGGLVVAFLWLNPLEKVLSQAHTSLVGADGGEGFEPNAFIRIGTDGLVQLFMPSIEMGQGAYTGQATLLAEELGLGLDQIVVEHAPPNAQAYSKPQIGGIQATGGSTTIRYSWTTLRQAGAGARALLLAAAAQRWRVDPGECSLARGLVTHAASGRALGFGELADAAAKLPKPAKVQVKDPKDFTLIGRPLRRVDSAGKVDGSLQFGIDIRVPGMKVATVKASPTFGGKLASVDETRARAIPGVLQVLKLDDAVAVVGEHFWAAKQGLEALEIVWDHGANEQLDNERLFQSMADASHNGKALVARQVGKLDGVQGKAVEATYELPMLAHATMEPLNTVVSVRPDSCEIWVGTQVPTRGVDIAAKMTGLAPEKITLHNQYMGGGFGRRLFEDSIGQAVAFAKQVEYPLKVIWTREEDIAQDRYRPAYYDRLSAVLDGDGRPLSWTHRTTSASVMAIFMPKDMAKPGSIDTDAVEGAIEPPYALPNLRVEWVRHAMPAGVPVGWWRGVGPAHNVLVVESFIDELAHVAGKDPLDYRRGLLQKNPRALGVLELAASQIGWGQAALPARVGRGVAVSTSFGSYLCVIVEVEVSTQGEIKLRRAVAATDCGVVINPNTLEAQVQGGLVFGWTAALYSGITLKNGAVQQRNFNDYRMLRINDTPPIEVHQVASKETPGGIGEAGTAIAAPCLSNAIFAATGVRVRKFPIDRAVLI